MYLLIAVWGSSSRFPTFVRTKEYSAMKLMMMLVARFGADLHRHLRHLHRSGSRHLRPADALRLFGEDRLRPRVPEVGVPAVRDRRRLPGRPLAVPHMVARRPRLGADGRLDAARRRADEAGRLRYPAARHPAISRWARSSGCPAWSSWRRSTSSTARSRAMAQTDFKYVIGYSSVSATWATCCWASRP